MRSQSIHGRILQLEKHYLIVDTKRTFGILYKETEGRHRYSQALVIIHLIWTEESYQGKENRECLRSPEKRKI